MSKRRLGKGIDALLQGRDLEQLSNMSSIMMVNVADISPNPEQPRKHFSDDSLQELAESISQKGIIQPIIAEDQGDGTFIIVAGERRYRAAQLAGLEEVPVISQEFSEDEKLEIALIENIQREDLNPVDEARAIKQILDHSGDTQDEVAKRLGKSRSTVTNALRILNLGEDVILALSNGTISGGHARALLRVRDPEQRAALFKKMVEGKLSVRIVEELAAGHESPVGNKDDRTNLGDPGDIELDDPAADGGEKRGAAAARNVELRHIEEALIHRFGSRAVVRGSDQRGRLEFPYTSTTELEQLLSAMGVDLNEA